MDDDLLTLGLQLDGGPDADTEELDELTRQLRSDLLELDVRSVDPVRTGNAPPGTRAADILAIGGLLVTRCQGGVQHPDLWRPKRLTV